MLRRWIRPCGFVLVFFCLATIALSATTAEPLPAAVSVTANLSSKSITQDELLRFSITVSNKSTEPLLSFRLSVPPDGYQWQEIHAYGLKGADAYYRTSSNFKDAKNVLFPVIPPGGSYMAWGYLKPIVSHKAAAITTAAEWTLGSQKAGEPPFSAAVEFGENTVQSPGDILWGYVGVLALPVVLALLPFLLNNILKRRDDRSETLKLMLTQSLEYAAKYYLPLSAAAQRLVDALQPSLPNAKGNPPNALSSFYYVIYMEKRMTEQRKAVGGFYFKDQGAEILASMCWKKYSETLFGKDSSDELNRSVQACVNKLKDRENFDAFAKRLEMNASGAFANADAAQAWKLFQAKLTQVSVASLVVDLNALQALIDYEVNRPFENWYPTKLPTFTVERDVKQRLKELAKELRFTAEQTEYVDQIETYPVSE